MLLAQATWAPRNHGACARAGLRTTDRMGAPAKVTRRLHVHVNHVIIRASPLLHILQQRSEVRSTLGAGNTKPRARLSQDRLFPLSCADLQRPGPGPFPDLIVQVTPQRLGVVLFPHGWPWN